MCVYVGILHPPEPVLPGDVPAVHQNGLIMAMIPYILEEDATSKKRYLEGLYVDVGMVVSPGVGTDSVGDECREQAIKVEEKEHGPILVSQGP